MIAAFAFTVAALLLESIEGKILLMDSGEWEKTPEEHSGFWNRTTFTWLAATFRIGYAKVISVADLPGLDPKLESRTLHARLASTWAKCT